MHQPKSLTLDAAIDRAREFFVHTVGSREALSNIHFEEFECADNGDWLITFGYDRETTNPLARIGITTPVTERVYRQVQLDDEGAPVAIRIRVL